MRRAASAAVVVMIGVVGTHASAQAGVPQVISFQGRLADANGKAVTEAVDVTFSLYTRDTGGTAVWTEAHTGLSPADGLFSVMLGSVTTFASRSVDFGQELWLGVKVGADDEMTPRFRLGGAPSAFKAADADTLDGAHAADLLDKATYDADADGKVDMAAAADTAASAGSVDWTAVANVPADLSDGDDVGLATLGGVTPAIDSIDLVEGTGVLITPDDAADTITIAADVGVNDGQLVQVQASGMLPALDGSLLTGVDADTVGGQRLVDLDGRYVNAAGDDMTGPLYLPADGLVAGKGQLALSRGNVGIGTAEPQALLDVAGDAIVSGVLTAARISADQVSVRGGVDVSGPVTAKGGNSDEWNTAYGWGDHAKAGYLQTETDPQVGSNALNRVPKWSGSSLSTGSIYDNGNIGIGTSAPAAKLHVAGDLQVDGNITGTIDISNITGILGYGYTLAIPDIMNNYTDLEIQGIDPGGDYRCVILHGPGFDIERVEGWAGGKPWDQPGLSDEHPLIFEAPEPYATNIKAWFDQASPDKKVGSIIVRDLAGTEAFRWNFFEILPNGYEAAADGRTKFTTELSSPPDNYPHWQEDLPSHGTDMTARNMATDKWVEINGVCAYYFALEEWDEANRTVTFTYDWNEGREIRAWVESTLRGTGMKRDMSIVEQDAGGTEISRRNYFGVFPIKYELYYGFGLNTKIKSRVVISYDFWEDG